MATAEGTTKKAAPCTRRRCRQLHFTFATLFNLKRRSPFRLLTSLFASCLPLRALCPFAASAFSVQKRRRRCFTRSPALEVWRVIFFFSLVFEEARTRLKTEKTPCCLLVVVVTGCCFGFAMNTVFFLFFQLRRRIGNLAPLLGRRRSSRMRGRVIEALSIFLFCCSDRRGV